MRTALTSAPGLPDRFWDELVTKTQPGRETLLLYCVSETSIGRELHLEFIQGEDLLQFAASSDPAVCESLFPLLVALFDEFERKANSEDEEGGRLPGEAPPPELVAVGTARIMAGPVNQASGGANVIMSALPAREAASQRAAGFDVPYDLILGAELSEALATGCEQMSNSRISYWLHRVREEPHAGDKVSFSAPVPDVKPQDAKRPLRLGLAAALVLLLVALLAAYRFWPGSSPASKAAPAAQVPSSDPEQKIQAPVIPQKLSEPASGSQAPAAVSKPAARPAVPKPAVAARVPSQKEKREAALRALGVLPEVQAPNKAEDKGGK